MDYVEKIGILSGYIVFAFVLYFVLNKYYFSRKEQKLKQRLEESKVVINNIEESVSEPKILNDLEEEDNIFSDSWESEENNFSLDDHEITDPYKQKTLDDVFNGKKDIDLDQDVKDLLN